MKSVRLNLAKRSYNIIIGKGCLSSLGRTLKKLGIGCDAFIITNPKIKSLYAKPLERSLKQNDYSIRYKLIADTEKSKSAPVSLKILNEIARYDKKKRIFIIALGGGVVGDLSGFIASVYRRGIPYIQIPTSLLSQVDSAIGGKAAIDLSVGKNLVGSFYQPSLVASDISLLKSLPAYEIKNGLAEIVKYGVIKDARFFAYLEKNYKKAFGYDQKFLDYVIYKCAKIKASVVEKDERDNKDIRIILNCGHTIGHAIEAAGNYKSYTHGEAVALGILVESLLSYKLGLLSKGALSRVENLIKNIGLPTRIKNLKLSRIMDAQEHDKKIISGVNRFVLPTRIGAVKICQNIPTAKIRKALKQRMI